MNTQTVKQLYITAAWWSIAFLLTVTPWIISVTVITEGWIRLAALPLSVLLPVAFGAITDKLSNKEEVVLESHAYEKGM